VINQLIIPYGNRSKIVLSDNTTVWVNAGSRLLYPAIFNGNKREVVLFGEAFFDVEKNDSKPFIVKTGSLEIKVLGTQFNISAYPDDSSIQTVLKEGSVSIKRNGAHFFESDLILRPNQMASFNKTTNESKVFNVDADYYTIWTKGLLSFQDIDMNRITKKLERYYNITFKYENPLQGVIKISGKLDLNQNQEEVVEYLAKVSGTSFQRISNQHYIIK
jgi:transmembrane sensor